ncbi:MAG: tRNA 2-thiocytidine biosynthesis TtcA family protein [Treponema sp.]|nr:tRNA 2-thiocytidine biosynthesis TtcA family protein [Treponema sp.]
MKKKRLFSIIDKAVYDYKLIQPGDKILIGASGGKDSTALIEYFSNRVRRPDADFEYLALNIQSEISGPLPENIVKLFEEWQVPLKVIKINVQERLKEGKKMNCFWCSTQRRTELNNFAMENGFNKIALGHHADDVLETLLMNALQKGELSTMIPSLKYQKYPVSVIRPLYYAFESEIIAHAKENGFYGWTCTCNFQDNSTRKDARKKIALITDSDPKKKQHLFDSLKNINLDYLP